MRRCSKGSTRQQKLPVSPVTESECSHPCRGLRCYGPKKAKCGDLRGIDCRDDRAASRLQSSQRREHSSAGISALIEGDSGHQEYS